MALILVIAWLTPSACQTEKINALLIGTVNGGHHAEVLFREDPMMSYTAVPSRSSAVKGGMKAMQKYIRQYFPRTYEEVETFDYIMLLAPEYYLFTNKQDSWLYTRIVEGAGGFNDGSVFSIIGQIHSSWANSLTQKAFPNDAPAVVARGGGGESPLDLYIIRINRQFPDPVMTPYVDYGVEKVTSIVSRYVIPRQTAGVLAYQYGNFASEVPFLVSWDHGQGRTMTCGGFIGFGSWFGEDNPYGGDIIINMVLYSTGRDLIEDVDVFHRLKINFREFRNKMELLISLKDFVDRLGANTQRIQDRIWKLEEMGQTASNQYLEQDFMGCEETFQRAFDGFAQAEAVARKVKDNAMLWVYIIEWLITCSTLFVSGSLLWSIMVKRKLYHDVRTTKLVEQGPD